MEVANDHTKLEVSVEKPSKKFRVIHIFSFLLLLLFITFFFIIESIDLIIEKIHKTQPSYDWPKYQDFLILLWALPVTIMSKIIIEWLSKHCVHLFIAKKYKNEDGSFTEEGLPISNKMRQNIYKALWSIVFTTFGHMVLHQIKYFPWELFGSGDMNKLLEEGYPAYYFHDRPYLFDTLYILNLAYYLMDFIYLVFINDHQSDFFLMVLHHLATILLIFFSYMVNLSNIGCIVFHLHNFSNIFIYFVRISMFSDVGTIVKAFFTTLLILNFTFTRIYVFGKLIVYCYYFLIEWHWIVFYLWSLKVLLLVMHVYWVYEIFRKFYLYLTENKVEDIARYKTQ